MDIWIRRLECIISTSAFIAFWEHQQRCSAHTLNLVVNDAAKCCLEATAFFDLVLRVYVLFTASTRLWEVLNRHVSNLTVKPLSETRWESRIDALKPLRYQLDDIYSTMLWQRFADDTNLTHWHIKWHLRTDQQFKLLFKDVLNLCIQYKLDPVSLPRQRRPPSRFTGSGEPHVSDSAESHFRASFFLAVDTAVTQLSTRFDKKSPGLQSYLSLEQILLTGEIPSQSTLRDTYNDLLKCSSMPIQLAMFRTLWRVCMRLRPRLKKWCQKYVVYSMKLNTSSDYCSSVQPPRAQQNAHLAPCDGSKTGFGALWANKDSMVLPYATLISIHWTNWISQTWHANSRRFRTSEGV